MTGWELFVKDFHESQWPVWFLAAAFAGYFLGWKACKLWHFNALKLKMHEKNILHKIREQEARKSFVDPFTKKPFKAKNVTKQTIPAGTPVTRAGARGGIAPVVPAPQPPLEDSLLNPIHPLNPITDPLNVYGTHTHDAPASSHHHDTPTHHSDPVPDCSPSHDSGSSGGGYDSGSSSSDCGSGSSDSGSSGGGGGD